MSVTEILREINHLPPEAIPEIEAAIQRRRDSLAHASPGEVRTGFDDLAGRVFDKHRETMARLAE